MANKKADSILNTPVIFSADNLNMSYGEQTILNNASLTVHAGEHVGLVGRNGCGKSTFLRMVSGGEEPDSGSIMRKKNLVTGFLPQEFSLDTAKNVYDNILAGAKHITDMIKEYESLPYDSPQSHELEKEISILNAWNMDHRIKLITEGLKAPAGSREINTLSGGEKKKSGTRKSNCRQPQLINP